MKYTLLPLLLVLVGPLCAQPHSPEVKAITDVLMKQQQHWNEGNLIAFMEGYWKSDSLVFVGRNGVTTGWHTVLRNYQQAYPNREAMGLLTFTILRVDVFTNQTALVVGQWKLKRAQDEPGGFFTLVWRRIKGKWVIVADHTS
ncbi:MAG: nuclear transport factor 2 family protein [Cyclobacteriaceae bacterium]|nr:nuclear transport factor 2 family protein [Cyclobacteriaceae bacterium]MCX7637746.1 nuclear transport factor 2 family protein [Cyclobacteriaceae bacterium]MDW8331782.1 nuclear transport factor 2 family protein [Cyclobacteriaceae bacterium]